MCNNIHLANQVHLSDGKIERPVIRRADPT
jgi:hypothetical protein